MRILLFAAVLLGGCKLVGITDQDNDGQTPEEGDCYDAQVDYPGTSVAPEDIYSNAPEIFYNGVPESCHPSAAECLRDDTNCYGSAVDCDKDGDGWCITGYRHTIPDGWAEGDCDDLDPDVHPGVTEVCDGVDNDCDGTKDIDPDPEHEDTPTWYQDRDNDRYGRETNPVFECNKPAGYADNADDCDDDDNNVNLGAAETCDDVDNDCDGGVDEDPDGDVWYWDHDGDNFGDNSGLYIMRACEEPTVDVNGNEVTFVDNNDDCDDLDASINPSAAETCDDVDNDCDGGVDEGLSEEECPTEPEE